MSDIDVDVLIGHHYNSVYADLCSSQSYAQSRVMSHYIGGMIANDSHISILYKPCIHSAHAISSERSFKDYRSVIALVTPPIGSESFSPKPTYSTDDITLYHMIAQVT